MKPYQPFLFALCFLLNAVSVFAQPGEFNYDESRVPKYELPELLTTQDGTKITTQEQWLKKRRPEILALFEEHVFGRQPSTVPQLRVRERSRVDDALGGAAIRRELTVFFTDDDAGPAMDVLVYTPSQAEEPVPVFLGYNFCGNHTVDPDPAIHVTESWVRNDRRTKAKGNKASAEDHGVMSRRWDAKAIVEAGLGLATIYYGDIDPDFHDEFYNGIHAMFDEQGPDRPADAGGSISAWSWGLSRALDVLETDALVDGERVAVFGHSRLGKTSLWAGATDPRFAMVISNNSGCGGAALSRRRFGETVARINTSFPHWFCRNHRQYNNNEDALPVDHHMLIALSAPRPVYVASAKEDQWADPRGEMLSVYHAGPAYELFGKTGLPGDQLPALNSPIHTDVAYHIREGKHDVTAFDWQQYIKFALKHFAQ